MTRLNELGLDPKYGDARKEPPMEYTVEQAKAMRQDLEGHIADAIYMFECKTGMTTARVEVIRDGTTGERRKHLARINLVIEL